MVTWILLFGSGLDDEVVVENVPEPELFDIEISFADMLFEPLPGVGVGVGVKDEQIELFNKIESVLVGF